MLNAFFTLLISFGGVATMFWLVIGGLSGIMREFEKDSDGSRLGLILAMFLCVLFTVTYVLIVMALAYKYLP